MPIASEFAKNEVAKAYTALGQYISLHTADPGADGANEVTGGDYARQPTTWSAPAGGQITGDEITLSIPAGTYTHAAIWSGATDGNYVDSIEITETTIGSAGEMKLTPIVVVS